MSSVETLIDHQTTNAGEHGVMKALVYRGPGHRAWETKPKPTIRERGDAIVRITTSTICGTDLHILKGDVPSVTSGRILGHEGVGVIEAIGSRNCGTATSRSRRGWSTPSRRPCFSD